MDHDTYCPAIHSGISVKVNQNGNAIVRPCCEMQWDGISLNDANDYFNHTLIKQLQNDNKKGIWSSYCNQCKTVEDAGEYSYRLSQIDRFKENNTTNISTLDLMYDNSCNLACRSCGPDLSTYWQKHLLDNNIINQRFNNKHSIDLTNKKFLSLLDSLNIESISQIKISGGEPFIGTGYWELLSALPIDIISNTELLIQSNGTIRLRDNHLKTFEKFRLVKISFSIDGFGDRFNYLRWPGDWHQLTNNLNYVRDTVPSNVMFNVEETISIFNLAYHNEVKDWVAANFSSNKDGDPILYNVHLANGIFSLDQITNEYIDDNNHRYINDNFTENSENIIRMIKVINQFDLIRNQSWLRTFPKLKDYYRRYI